MRRSSAWVFCLVGSTLLAACGGSDQAPAYPLRSCQTTLTYRPSASISGGVSVEGEWDTLAPPGKPMTANADGSYSLSVTLDPRDYGYAFLVDGQPIQDPQNPYTRWVGGAEYSLLRVEDCHAPQVEVRQFTQTGATVEVNGQYVDGVDGKGIDPAALTVTLDGAPVTGAFDAKSGAIQVSQAGLSLGKHTIRINATDRAGRAADEQYLPFWVETTPYRWGDGLMYFAFTDRFVNGDGSNDNPVPGVETPANYQGGDWAGITQKIDAGYFDALGVRAIWISPVNKNPDNAFASTTAGDTHQYSGYHGYWPIAARETQPRFGSLEDLKALTAAAHAHGIRVLGDLVLNHVHDTHPYFLQHRSEGWFNTENECLCSNDPNNYCNWENPQGGLICWFTDYLPDVNWRNATAAWAEIDDAVWWLKEGDLDGYRVDAVKQMEPIAVRTLSGKLHELGDRTGVHYYLVGETLTGDRARISQYIGPHAVDGQFDFPLFWMARDVFTQRLDDTTHQRKATFVDLDATVAQGEAQFPPGALMSPLLGNQDMSRFESAAEGLVGDGSDTLQAWQSPAPTHGTSTQAFDDLKFGFAFLLTQPGVPLVYYGDEIGLPGMGDPDNRRMMRFGSDLTLPEADLLAFVQKVGQARRASKGIQRGTRTALLVEPDVYVYQRDDLDSTNGAVIALNRSASARQVTLSLAGNLGQGDLTFTDAIGGGTVSSHAGKVTVTIPADTAAIYVAP